VLCAAAVFNAPAGAQAPSTPEESASFDVSQLAERALHRRAVEAVIWGMPAVNFERMLQAAIANGAKPNQVVYWSQPVNEKNQTLTPNPDTIYLNPFYDTTRGPVVVEIPPTCLRRPNLEGNLSSGIPHVTSSWQRPLQIT
jgi:hypothetical protein